MRFLRGLFRGILRAIGTYNPAPLDRPTDYDLGRGRLYVAAVNDKGERSGPWQDAGPCESFRITPAPHRRKDDPQPAKCATCANWGAPTGCPECGCRCMGG